MDKKSDLLSLPGICVLLVVGTICVLALWQNVKLSSEFIAAIASSLLTYAITNKATNGNVIVETLPLLQHQEPKE